MNPDMLSFIGAVGGTICGITMISSTSSTKWFSKLGLCATIGTVLLIIALTGAVLLVKGV